MGPARINKPPCRISDLPKPDIVIISHNQCVISLMMSCMMLT